MTIPSTPSTPSLPCLKELPYNLVCEAITGFLCGRLYQVNPYLTATIFAIRCLASNLLYQLANTRYGKTNLESQKIFLITFTLVSMTFLITLKELNLIGHFLSCVIGAATLGYLIKRGTYVQNEERQSIIHEIKEKSGNQTEMI